MGVAVHPRVPAEGPGVPQRRRSVAVVSVLHPERWSPWPLRVLAVQEGTPEGRADRCLQMDFPDLGRAALRARRPGLVRAAAVWALRWAYTGGSLSWA